MTQTIMFPRGKVNIVANIINTVLEPLGESHQVVFFARDKAGVRYRVPKSEVVVMGVVESPKKGKKKGRKIA